MRERRGVGRSGRDYRDLIVAERRRLVSRLEDLSAEQWDHATLCEGWQVRHVVAHLIFGGTRWSVLEAAGFFVRYRGDVDGGFSDDARRRADMDPAALLEQFRGIVDSRFVQPGLGAALMWCDNVIHGLDIGKPLGWPYSGSLDELAETADCLRAMTWPSRHGRRADGLRFVASDIDWTGGDGPEVAGPIESIVLSIAGRAAGFDELDGPGVPVLAARS